MMIYVTKNPFESETKNHSERAWRMGCSGGVDLEAKRNKGYRRQYSVGWFGSGSFLFFLFYEIW